MGSAVLTVSSPSSCVTSFFWCLLVCNHVISFFCGGVSTVVALLCAGDIQKPGVTFFLLLLRMSPVTPSSSSCCWHLLLPAAGTASSFEASSRSMLCREHLSGVWGPLGVGGSRGSGWLHFCLLMLTYSCCCCCCCCCDQPMRSWSCTLSCWL